jgi:hypothetical protein
VGKDNNLTESGKVRGEKRWTKARQRREGGGEVSTAPSHPRTPDGRYMVVRGRLWRVSNPALNVTLRTRLVTELMAARRELRRGFGDPVRRAKARKVVDQAKIGLGERGPVWWDDGAPDYNRRLAVNTPYADWFRALRAPADADSVPSSTTRKA